VDGGVGWEEEEYCAPTRGIVTARKTARIILTISVLSLFFIVILTNYILTNFAYKYLWASGEIGSGRKEAGLGFTALVKPPASARN
jgi:hypothetical protein